MATPNVGILTNAGKNLIDRVNAGKTKITFSKIAFSSMNNNQLTDEQIKALTTVAPQEIVVNNPKVTLDNNTGETRIRATGNNEALTDGVYVKTYAVYAKDDSGNEILYGTTISPNPNYLPEYDGVTPQAVTYSYKVNISNTSNITFTNSNDVYVSDTDLAEALQPYAKTVDVNQQLDKKVNIADMRKPASDVAGIEEVNTKQDKIGYTPADDSKVVHTTDTSNWQKQAMFNPGSYMITSTLSAKLDFKTLLTTKFSAPGIYYIRDDYNSSVFVVNSVVISEGSGWWYAYGIDESGDFVYRQINPSTDTGWVKASNDSKVAHLSGANNFDTVPTVNNNSLLLASSLPSDLARTGQANTFSLPQTFSQGVKTLQTRSYDDANSLVNEGLYYNTNSSIKNGAGSLTTGYIQVMSGYGEIVRQIMYSDTDGGVIYDRTSQDGGSSWGNWVQIISWDQIPGDLAFTDQAQTFKQPQTFSIAPVINDASKDKGDNQAATMADLKSVEDSAWHYIITKDMGGNADISLLYQKDVAKKCIYVIFIATLDIGDYSSGYSIKLDMSSVVKSFDNNSSFYATMGDTSFYEVSGSGSVINFGTFKGTVSAHAYVEAANCFSSSTGYIKDRIALGVSEFA